MMEVESRVGTPSIPGSAARQVRHPRARDHGLGWRAALVDAGAADVDALDQRGAPARPGECPGQGAPGLAGADDDGLVTGRSAHGRSCSRTVVGENRARTREPQRANVRRLRKVPGAAALGTVVDANAL